MPNTSSIESELTPHKAYATAIQAAQVKGLQITDKISDKQFKVSRHHYPVWWWAIALLLCFPFVLPGVIFALAWRPTWFCTLRFGISQATGFNSTISVTYSSGPGEKFYRDVAKSVAGLNATPKEREASIVLGIGTRSSK